MATEKKLFLLDAMALIYRAHFALSKNPRVNSQGQNTGAVLGFVNSLVEVLTKEKPTHLGVAFDPSGPTFRHEQFPDYKAQREETPEDIRWAIPVVKELVQAFGHPVLEVQGYEADDVIGTLARKAEAEGFMVYMMTPDKDYGQLVTDRITLYKPAYMGNAVDLMGPEQVKAKWGIAQVSQVIDMLGMQGDSADNIPGIPGVGPKTAQKLIEEYGSLEKVLKHAADQKGKLKERLEEFGEQGLLSKELATIACDVPIELDTAKMVVDNWDRDKLKALFDELEFRTLAKRLLAGGQPAKEEKQMGLFDSAPAVEPEAATVAPQRDTLYTTPHHYHLVKTPDEVALVAEALSHQDTFCFDTETDGLNPHQCRLLGLALSWKKAEAYYVALPEEPEVATELLKPFQQAFAGKGTKVAQNLKFDLLVLRRYGLRLAGPMADTMLAHYLISPDMRHGMDLLAETYLNYSPVSIESLIGKKGKNQGSMADLTPEEVCDYAAEDADVTLQLWEKLRPELDQLQLRQLHDQLEAPLVPVLATMEAEGITVDREALAEMSQSLAEEASKVEQGVYETAGVEFNLASPKQLGEVLFDKLKLEDKPKKTKSGQYATGEEVLSRLARQHPIANDILTFRELVKLRNTYVDALPELINPQTGRIHTSYNQAVAATGRLSSTNPNLQNIPIRTERGREIRKAFVAKDADHLIVAADYSQIELRIMAAFAKDEVMTQAFADGRDIHATTAAKLFGVDVEEVTREQRGQAKTANFGIIYGISAFGLSQRLEIPRGQAAEIIDSYFREFSAVKAYMDQSINDAREKGYVQTILGRRRYLPDITSGNATLRGMAERNAINAPIQGSAADLIKKAMIDVQAWLEAEKLQSKMLLQVHDELVFEVPKSELATIETEVPKLMADAIDFGLPLVVETGHGSNWLQAH